MAGDDRTDTEIRREITSEREQLADALGDLREGVAAKRGLATVVGGVAAAGLAAATVLKVVRRFRGG